MDVIDDAGEDDHPELPPPRDVWLAERRVFAAAAHLRDVEASANPDDGLHDAVLTYRTAWLRFMVSLCNLPLAERPKAVEHVMDTLREAQLLRPTRRRPESSQADVRPSPTDVPPEVSHE